MKKIFTLLITVALLGSVSLAVGTNSIGVSPSTVSVENIKPGLSVNREIVISRNNTEQMEVFVATTDNSEASSWLSFVSSNEVVMAKDQNRASLFVKITVPLDASFMRYTPTLRIVQKKDLSSTGVSIQAGVIITMDILVTDRDVVKLEVLSAKIDDFEEGQDLKLLLTMKNDGNVATAPSRVMLVVKNAAGKEISTLESKEVDTVEPLSTKEVTVVFSGHNLLKGDYLADLEVYDTNGDDIFSYNMSFRVTEALIITPDQLITKFYKQALFYWPLIVIGVVLIIVSIIKLSKRSDKTTV